MAAPSTSFPSAPGQRVVSASARMQAMKAELVEKASQVIPDPPLLINAVSKRVRQLNQGRPPLIEKKPGMREADVALTEIIEGKIKIVRDEVIESEIL